MVKTSLTGDKIEFKLSLKNPIFVIKNIFVFIDFLRIFYEEIKMQNLSYANN